MFKKENRAALVSTLLLAVIIIGHAASDPGGLFAIVSWSGSRPIATLWWWAPYLLFSPLLLLLNFTLTRHFAGSALPGTSRIWLFFRMWLIVIVATAAAWFVNASIALYGGMAGKEYLLPLSGTLAFLLWSSGYATLKLACVGWLPAAAGLVFRPSHDAGGPEANNLGGLGTFTAGCAALLLALIAPWTSNHWWMGSPVGYIYRESARLFAPIATATPFRACAALLVCGLVVWVQARGSFARLPRSSKKSTVFAAGALAGVAAALALLVFQAALLLAAGLAASMNWASGGDYWFITALELLAVEACSFALVLACCTGLAALAGWRLLGTSSGKQCDRQGIFAGAAATVILAGMSFYSANKTPAAYVAQTPPPTMVSADSGLSPLSVRHDHDHAVLVDQHGSQVMLRGVNVNQLGEYYQADPGLPGAQPLTRQDFADMAAIGINSVRLTLSWSRLEPQRGQYSQQYLDAMKQAVSWAAENHIYVVLDIHQDAWSTTVVAPKGYVCRDGTEPMKGWDGAPAWATLTDDAPPCEYTGRDLAPNVSRAFESFYFDRDGVQTELVNAWGIIAGNFADNRNVIGYDLLNEPNFAETPPVSSTLLLTNYYARSIAAIRKAETANHGYAHPVVIEPSIFWSGFGVDNLPPPDSLTDSQLVYSPHLYNESITSDQALGINLVSIERGFRLAQHGASQLGAALWIGEWGFFGDPKQQAGLWQRQANAEDTLQTGSAIWIWKQACGDPHVYPGKSAGNIVRADCPDGHPKETEPVVRRILERPYVRSAPGRIFKLAQSAGVFSFSGSTDAASQVVNLPNCDLEAWVPGTAEPTLKAAEGVSNTRWQAVESGSSVLGSSGGWILHGCVTAKRYRVEISHGDAKD